MDGDGHVGGIGIDAFIEDMMVLLYVIVRWFVFGIIYGGFVKWFVFGIMYDGFVIWYR